MIAKIIPKIVRDLPYL